MYYVLKRKDGVSITQVIDGDIDTEVKKIDLIDGKTTLSYREIKREDIPQDRTFRNAWNYDLNIDMGKAREIIKDKLREYRASLLAALDVQYQRADEEDNQAKKKEIVTRKKVLRDITDDPKISNAKTPDELKVTLDELKELLR